MSLVPVVYVKGQYNHLIARRLQELGAESRLIPSTEAVKTLQSINPDGLVMGGGPQRVRTAEDLTQELASAAEIIKVAKVPLLCICVTHQLLATVLGGRTDVSKKPEFGPVEVHVELEEGILRGLGSSFTAWESHNDEVVQPPPGFRVIASSETCSVQAMAHEKDPLFGVQFHPEVSHTSKGVDIFRNFLNLIRK